MSQPPYQPYPQEPQPGQPGQPGYQQPGYQQPGYQQPGYQQPGYPPSSAPGGAGYPPPGTNAYPQPGDGSYPPANQGFGGPPPANQGFGGPPPANQGFGGPPPANQGFGGPPPAGVGYGSAPPPKKRSVGKIIALVLVAVVVLCAGGIGTIYYFNRDKVKDVVEASKIRVVEPDKLGTRPKTTDANLNGSLDETLKQVKTDPQVTGTAGAIYGNPAKLDIVMLIAASSIGGSAQDRYDVMIKGIGGGFAITGLKDVDPGPLGGIAKCGDGTVSSVPLGICMWADSGSFAMLMLFNKKGADLQKNFVSYRGQIEQKS
jgi:hypothetical protein